MVATRSSSFLLLFQWVAIVSLVVLRDGSQGFQIGSEPRCIGRALVLQRQQGASPFVRRERAVLKMAMPQLPSNVEKYSQVPTLDPAFTATTIPPGLMKDHTTKARTWGVIRVFQGLLEYTIDGTESFELSPTVPGIIEPQRKHHVKALSDDVEFVVEFHREVD